MRCSSLVVLTVFVLMFEIHAYASKLIQYRIFYAQCWRYITETSSELAVVRTCFRVNSSFKRKFSYLHKQPTQRSSLNNCPYCCLVLRLKLFLPCSPSPRLEHGARPWSSRSRATFHCIDPEIMSRKSCRRARRVEAEAGQNEVKRF